MGIEPLCPKCTSICQHKCSWMMCCCWRSFGNNLSLPFLSLSLIKLTDEVLWSTEESKHWPAPLKPPPQGTELQRQWLLVWSSLMSVHCIGLCCIYIQLCYLPARLCLREESIHQRKSGCPYGCLWRLVNTVYSCFPSSQPRDGCCWHTLLWKASKINQRRHVMVRIPQASLTTERSEASCLCSHYQTRNK